MRKNASSKLYAVFILSALLAIFGQPSWAQLCAVQKSVSPKISPAQHSAWTIYGDHDQRCEANQIQAPQVQVALHSIVLLAEKSDLSRHGSNWKLPGSNLFGPSLQLCESERFFRQPRAGFCTGFLIAPDRILTAGHCVEDQGRCSEIAVVSNYSLGSDGIPRLEVAAEDVASCKRVWHSKNQDLDLAVIWLDHPMTAKPLVMHRHPHLSIAIGMGGHPYGLPLKYSSGRLVSTQADWLVAALDAQDGNSGSPVLDEASGDFIGLLIDGEDDFEDAPAHAGGGKCQISKSCYENSSCGGEHIMRTERILKALGEI